MSTKESYYDKAMKEAYNPFYLWFHPKERYNEEFFEITAKKCPWMFAYAARKLKNNERFLGKMARANGMVLRFLREDEHYILTTVRADNLRGWEFKKVYSIDNSFLVSEAVSQNGLALAYASERMKHNKAIVIDAINQNWRAYRYASKTRRKDDEIINLTLLKAYSSEENLMYVGFEEKYDSPKKFFTDDQLINFFTDEKQMEKLKKEIKKTALGLLKDLNPNDPEDKKYAIKVSDNTKVTLRDIKELQEDYIALSAYKKDNIITQKQDEIREM